MINGIQLSEKGGRAEVNINRKREIRMNVLISREAVIDAYGDWYVEEGTEDGFIGTVKQLLEGWPPAEPEPKMKPIFSSDGFADGNPVYDYAECQKCGYAFEDTDKAWGEPFCPHCGVGLDWRELYDE